MKTDQILKLSAQKFDQSEQGWRSLYGKIPNKKLADIILKYIKLHPKNKLSNLMFWHAGQLLAADNNVSKAVDLMKKSYSDYDQEWNDYVNLTIAFLNKNKKPYYIIDWSKNYNRKSINKMFNNFHLKYSELYL